MNIFLYYYPDRFACVRIPTQIQINKKRVPKDFWWFIRHLGSVVKSAALQKFSYPQVPGSIPAANTSTQIHMDLSKKTLKQGF